MSVQLSRFVPSIPKPLTDLLVLALVKTDKPFEEVFARRLVVVAASVVREVLLQRRPAQLFFEQIDLVQEKNDRSLGEPSGVADRVEKSESFLHAVLFGAISFSPS